MSSKKASSSPPKNGKSSPIEAKQVEVKKEPVSEKKKASPSPKKTDAKAKDKKSGHKELDSNSNKTTPSKPSKKFKSEPLTVTETPQKTISNDDSIMESPSYDPLEKRKQQAENYRKFLSSHKEGAKNPGSKPVPEVMNI